MHTERLPQRVLRSTPGGGLEERRWHLEWLTGPHAGQRVVISGPMIIGGGEGADVQVPEPTLSRRHVELKPTAHGVVLTDLQSTNGTYVGGARVERALLERDTVVVLGRVRGRIGVEDVAAGAQAASALAGLSSQSESMQRLLGLAQAVAHSDATVLIEGEPGVGKEAVATAIHRTGPRAKEPLVTIDCRALSFELAESELFGHARGAFTGAHEARAGLFEQAGFGTVLLDEVAELPLSLQPRLLRVLEAGTFRRVGDTRERTLGARVIALTAKSLERLVADGSFRADLYFRLAVVRLAVPALRERLADVPELLRQFVGELGWAYDEWPAEALAPLLAAAWPGNVRQLKALAAQLAAEKPHRAQLAEAVARALARVALPGDQGQERQRVVSALVRHGGNQTLAAKELGMARGTLISRMEAFGIGRPRKR